MQAILLLLSLLVALATVGLGLLNLKQLEKPLPALPAALAEVVEDETLLRANAYSRERARLGLATFVASRGLTLVFFFGGAGALYDRLVRAHVDSFVGRGVVFVLGIALFSFLFSLPISLYSNFVLEARYGFNRMTLGLWAGDRVKGALLSGALLSGCAALALYLVQAFPTYYWLLAWALLAVFSVLMSMAWPYLIEPLFFKVRPFQDPELEPRIRDLAERARVHVSRVFQVDASRRSSHSNAYFSGLGPEKRVVLFDTLLARMTPREILAVLAHELGHYRLHHVLQRFVVGQLLSLAAFAAGAFALAELDPASWVGAHEGSFAFRALIVGFAFSRVEFVATPLFSYWSRHHERQADTFAGKLTRDPAALASGLAKLSRDNLSNLNPHPFYAAFYASHPPAIERISALSRPEPA
ncbi:MAG TPA: M48 family metallopeptidase [Polyangiaceae bacterium]|nr:M48 family metallopeptidase [Polyangiaceae bacterium]